MARRNKARQAKRTRRLRGMERVMAQAGVKWDREEASKVRAAKSQELSSRPYLEKPIALSGDGMSTTDWLPLPALLGLLLVGLGGYFVAETALAAFAHPVHWIGAAAGGLIGYAGGIVWYRLRGF